MKIPTKTPFHCIWVAALLFSSASQAGRPLVVDDANTADAGTGNIDVWFSRLPGNVNVWTVAPAYGIRDGVELGAALSTDTSTNVATTTLQAKFRLTPPQSDGCNAGTSFGFSQTSEGGGNTVFINGLLTCNRTLGAFNLNLGLSRAPDEATLTTWGVSFEREIGAFTGHVEYFGVEKAAPTLQLGLRTMVTKNLQLDGSVGSSNAELSYTLGLRFFF